MEACDICSRLEDIKSGIGIYTVGILMETLKELYGSDIIAKNGVSYRLCAGCVNRVFERCKLKMNESAKVQPKKMCEDCCLNTKNTKTSLKGGHR